MNQNERVKGFLEKLFINSKYSSEGLVDEALEHAVTIAEHGDVVKDILYRIAENRQRMVLDRRTKIFDDLYKRVVEARTQTFSDYDNAFAVLMKEGKGVQQNVARMKKIDDLRGILSNGKH